MERAAGFAHDDTAQAKLDKLDAVLAQTSTSKQDAALLRRDAVAAERRTLSGARSDARAAPTENAGSARFASASHWRAQNPVLMIFEDAHWTDPTSLEVFGRIVDRIATLRVLLIVTFRPEFEPPWVGRPHVTALTLNRLGEREIDAMIDARRRQQAASGERQAGHRRAHRRYSLVRGGDDQGGAGGGE